MPSLCAGFVCSLSVEFRSVQCCQACCFKTADAETILTNFVVDTKVNVHIFQPGGYSVHTKTTELGVYAAIMPTAPINIYFAKTLHATRSLSVDVKDNIQVGGLADIYLQALAVVTIWRFEVDWTSTMPVDLDAHAFDAWDCHVYFANKQCQHDGSHGLTVTLNRDNRDVLHGREVITVHQWPCDSDQATIGGYRDIWSCLAHFWVQIFSNHGFADVQGTVSIFRGGVLVHELQLPAAEQPDSFWIGFVLETLRILRLICYYGFLVSQLLSHFLRCGGQGLGQQHHPILL
ncbi:unnamed protein product [Symbiodinium pilosum]|uniref:Uncharacterized protein n=1 Tax=Symbiodinium pilosum TaxID=2952 RepID=A0A812N9E1_SYMPI|nr:unnamed protein product [Symbiodinium pilosum]